MRIGIIDLGTNSVRFDVHLIGQRGQVRLLHREKLMIRLGQGVFLDHKLDSAAIHRTVQAFTSFRRTANLLHAEKVIAFGTSALREATDADNLIQIIRRRTGIGIRVISGQEEAQLIATGILSNEQSLKGQFGLVDIGGGSTEISICEGKKVLQSASFQLGAARLQQVFLKKSPPGTAQPRAGDSPIHSFRKYVKSILLPKMIAEEWPKVTHIIGSSGTIRAVERILKKTGDNSGGGISRKDLEKLIQSMTTMSRSALLRIPGMEPKRVDMILSGAILLEECMIAVGAKSLITTGFSLRDGILDREIRLKSRQRAPDIRFQLEDIYAKAKRLGCNEHHFKQVRLIAETLFDGTQKIHKLKPEWKRYLSAAALLHDVGNSVTPTHHEIHSYYIVKNADFRAMELWESELIAQLCLKHNAGKISKKDLNFTRDRAKRHAFVRLLAILHVADALDRGHKSNIHIQKIRLLPGKVRISISGPSTDLEILRLDQKKALFEKIFRRQLCIALPEARSQASGLTLQRNRNPKAKP